MAPLLVELAVSVHSVARWTACVAVRTAVFSNLSRHCLESSARAHIISLLIDDDITVRVAAMNAINALVRADAASGRTPYVVAFDGDFSAVTGMEPIRPSVSAHMLELYSATRQQAWQS